ncbi:MAG: hypothetical protein JW751_08265 [Polyangiaceae bacterium]|nr:hypothetical protein [Polyangiaceae bacterium]
MHPRCSLLFLSVLFGGLPLGIACSKGDDGAPMPFGGAAATGATTGGDQPVAGGMGGNGAMPAGGTNPITDCPQPTVALVGNAAGDPRSIANNLVNEGGWVSGNAHGIQGAFYAYGDGVQCSPPAGNPCDARGCHVAGNIIVDDTYAAWGCGVGLQLNATCEGVLSAYGGAAKCFDLTLAGNPDGAPVRIGFTPRADMGSSVAPFYTLPSFTNGWSGTVCTSDASCPAWAVDQGCVETDSPYAIQIQIAGGENDGVADIALVGLVPRESGVGGTGGGGTGGGGSGGTPPTGGTPPVTVTCPSTTGAAQFGSTCDTLGTVKNGSRTYMLQNNIWNTSGSGQCVTGREHGEYVGFEITSADHRANGDAPAAYPSLVKGWHWGPQTDDFQSGRQLSSIGSIDTLWCFTPPSNGKYNVSYDMWLHPSNPNLGNADPAGGMEMMVWVARGPETASFGDAPFPIGSGDGAVDRFQHLGAWWRVYKGTAGSWTVVSYMRETNTTSVELDLKYFMSDAITRGYLTQNWYLLGVEAGFEIWEGGQGARSDSYRVEID